MHGILGCDAVYCVVGYQRFGVPSYLHLQGEVSEARKHQVSH